MKTVYLIYLVTDQGACVLVNIHELGSGTILNVYSYGYFGFYTTGGADVINVPNAASVNITVNGDAALGTRIFNLTNVPRVWLHVTGTRTWSKGTLYVKNSSEVYLRCDDGGEFSQTKGTCKEMRKLILYVFFLFFRN
jgi:hypothetical protein